MNHKTSVTALIILDGFGYRKEISYNAIHHAHTPNYDQWLKEYPHAILHASGKYVGLPQGNIGSSEAGHLVIGLGRIIKEPITIINNAIKDKSFFSNPLLINTLKKLKKGNTLHILGLLSDAGVHASFNHLIAFIKVAKEQGITNIIIHPFLDGRDTPPQSAGKFLQKLDHELKILGTGKIGSIHGRFYAMDRDKNWNRSKQTYRVLTGPQSIAHHSWQKVLEQYYEIKTTDEFVPPTQLIKNAYVQDGDGVIFLNFRPDRARQLTKLFLHADDAPINHQPIKLDFFITPVPYADNLKTTALYTIKQNTQNSLKDVLAQNGKTIFSIAETEKYAHVTYFFNGGREEIESHETRILVPSLHSKEYAQQPEMSAASITQKVLESLKKNPCDFYLINYANADMIGHSGNFGATITAIEFLDIQLGALYKQIVTEMNGTMYVTADHGNAEDKYDEKAHQPRTAHTTNPVPFIMLRKDLAGKVPDRLPLTQLADIAPFILQNMGLPVPDEMKHGSLNS